MKKLNFGCGDKPLDEWENVDIQKGPKIKKSFDFNKFPYPLKENSYDLIKSDMVLEHLNCPDKVLDELWRISKPNGTIEISVPHYTNKGAYDNLGHIHFFSEMAFWYYVNEGNMVNKKKKFEIESLEITPTSIGKIFPKKIRMKLGLFINGLLSQIHIKLKAVKDT
jgi:SAM-dependent methyltransferase